MMTAAIANLKNVVVTGSRVCMTLFKAIGKTPHIIAVVAASSKPNFHRPDMKTIDVNL
jgi:hypothetical protein